MAKTWNMICKHAKISSKMRGKTAPKQGEMTPDAWNLSRNAKLGTWNGLQLYKACIIRTWSVKAEARQPWDKHFYSTKRGKTVSAHGTKLACKNGPARGVMKQLTAAGPKQERGLLQHWRGAKDMTFWSRWQAPKIDISMENNSCKKWANKGAKK